MRYPKDIKYGVNDWPPPHLLILLAIQQFFLLAAYAVIVMIIFRIAGQPDATVTKSISLSMLALAFSGLLQMLHKGPVGSGYFALPVTSAIYLTASILAVKTSGLPGLAAMTIFAGIVEFFFAFFIQRLRFIFTSTLCGLVILTIGFELGSLGLDSMLGIGHTPTASHVGLGFLTAMITLAVMIICSIWIRGPLRMFPAFLGLLVGSLASWALGILPLTHDKQVTHIPMFAWPIPTHFAFHFNPALILPFFFAALAAGLRAMGTIVTAQSINDRDWRRADMVSVRKGIMADGLGNIFAGLLTVPGISIAPTTVAISKLSGVTSRYVALVTAILLAILSFSPIIARVFLFVPLSVIGAVLLFNGAYMMLAGIQLINTKPINNRSILLVGIAFLAGASRLITPNYYDHLPKLVGIFAASPLTITGLIAIILTLCFRIDIKKTAAIEQEKQFNPSMLSAQLRKKANSLDVPEKTLEAAICASDRLFSEMESMEFDFASTRAVLHYDQVDFTLKIQYQGPPFSLSFMRQNEPGEYMLEEQAFYYGLHKLFSHIDIDSYDVKYQNDTTTINLTFFT